MSIIELNDHEYETIKPLWEALNRLHMDRSTYFKDHFNTLTFEHRQREFMQKEQRTVFASLSHDKCKGYVMVSCEKDVGEIISIYVSPQYRQHKLGTALMERALAWLDDRGHQRIHIAVAEGNETALGFYRSFGFFPRFTIVQRKPS